MITSISLHHLLKAFPRRMALHGLRRTCNALASTRPWVELSHGRPSHGVISRFFFKSWHLRAIQTLWLQVCRITAVTFEFGDNIKFTGLQLGVPGNTFWETSRSEHSGTDVATIEAATLKDSRGSMNEWKSGTLLGNFFWLCWGLEKRSLQYQLHSFFLFCVLFLFFFESLFLILGGEGGGGRERHPESVFFQKCSDFSSLRSSTKKWMTSFPPRSPRASGVGEPCEKMVGDVSQLTTIQARQHGISLSPTVIFFWLSDIRYCRTDQVVKTLRESLCHMSHVVRHNCKSSPTNVWELKFRGSCGVNCVHKQENKPYTVFILIEGGVGYAFLYRDSRETHDDNDVAEIIILLLLVAVAVDCWFLMPQKLFGWGMAKIRETKRETDIARKVQRGADGSYMHQTQVVLFDRFATA